MYIITCPNYGSQEETEFQHFECKCSKDFDISRATYDEDLLQQINIRIKKYELWGRELKWVVYVNVEKKLN